MARLRELPLRRLAGAIDEALEIFGNFGRF
jgi:hypothetical protein